MERSARKSAGVNKNLAAEFVWPEGFGRGVSGEMRVGESLSHPTRKCTSERAKSTRTATSSRRSRASLNVLQKRLNFESELKRQELEKQKAEIENQMKLLHFEHELREAEIIEELEEKNSQSSIQSVRDERAVMSEVHEWVNNIGDNDVPGEVVKNSDNNVSQVQVGQSSDIANLCQTINGLLKQVCPDTSLQDKLLARQVIDKDFPIFDGDPVDWPLFYEQFNRISKMCAYNDEEIMVKLRKCLRGEAKSTVSGMMIASENTTLVIETLKLRYGRPELIIEVIISKIKQIQIMRDINMEKLIVFSNEVRNLVATMKNLKSIGHMNNPQLLSELFGKLPDILKLKWGEYPSSEHGVVDLDKFSLWLSEMANAACYVCPPKNISVFKDDVAKGNFKKVNSHKKWTGTVLKVVNCGYCDEDDHKISDCSKMKMDDLETRWNKVKGKEKEIPKPTTSENDHGNVLTVQQDERNILLRMLPVNIHGPNGTLKTLALCDEGSTVTLLESSIAKNLGLKGNSEPLCIQWTNDVVSRIENSEVMDIQISGVRNSKIFDLNNVHTIENLSLPPQTICMKNWGRYDYLKNLPIDDFYQEKPMILIGQDNINLTLPLQVRVHSGGGNKQNTPVATKCKLGWSLHGPNHIYCDKKNSIHSLHFCNQEKDENLHEIVKASYSTDSFGVLITPTKLGVEEERAMNIMKTTARRVESGFEIGLLWKHENLHLPESKTVALQRLRCLERKCMKNKKFGNSYCEKFRSYVEKGYIRKLSPDEAAIEPPHTWYLPHFATINPNKPDKIRLVFDAAAKSHGVSLNDNLLSGPDLLQSLVAVLLKFRQGKFAFAGDVREMFHQVKIREEDRCAQRLFWRNLDSTKQPDVFEMQVMTFGATCSPCCAQFIKNINAEEMATSPETLSAVTKKFYVDDYLDSKATEEEALAIALEVKNVMALGGFEVVNWVSNSSIIKERLNGNSVDLKNISDRKKTIQRVLGMWWSSDDDEFQFHLKIEYLDKKQNFTKRDVLKMVMQIFDPLGFLAHIIIGAKILLQDIWRSGVGWDDFIPENLGNAWKNWLEELRMITKLRIPRCYSPSIPIGLLQLHVFCDASENAFSSVAYLRIASSSKIDVAFVMAKTRVAPLKTLSIPKLELQAAVMASRLAETLQSELEMNLVEKFFWSDSECVLNWIRNDGKKYKPFVAHRIGEIQERTQVAEWYWVPTELNIADAATRHNFGGKITEVSTIWLNGPNFLKLPEEMWKEEIDKFSNNLKHYNAEEDTELKSKFVGKIAVKNSPILPEIRRFSKWQRLVRATAWFLRAITKWKGKLRKIKESIPSYLTVQEIGMAEKLLIRRSQTESFLEDIMNLADNRPLEKKSRLKNLCPEMTEDGLLVLGGRLSLANYLDVDTKKPPILCPKNSYTKLLLQFYHEKFGHHGVESILSDVRQKFWIIDGRTALKSTAKNCQKCKVDGASPKLPIMGQLPAVRLSPCIRAFTYVGMDYFGPYLVTIGRRKDKRWGVLFTCLSVRAVHLEIASSMTTDSTIMAIRRFISRRGLPEKIYCDNGTNLKGAYEELRRSIQELDVGKISDYTTIKGIEFSFIPPGAPHMGGAWERLVGSVKKSLGVIVYGQSLKEETLATLFTEAENIVNSRPLTHISVDPGDPEPLTPNHFLIGYAHTEGPPGDFESGKYLKKEWRKSQMLANAFWKRWLREYLPTLNPRKKWTDDQEPIKPGDIVLIVDETSPRNTWKMGKVERVYHGPDGRVRVADIQTQANIYKRPVSKLCKLPVEVEREEMSC